MLLSILGLSLTWPPSSDPQTVGYRVYYGPASGVYTQAIDAGPFTSIPLPSPTPRPFYSVVAPYSVTGLEADFSSELAYPKPVVIGYRLQGSPTVTGTWTNIASHTATNGGLEGGLFFRVVLDVQFQGP